jgi:hypothetical protein
MRADLSALERGRGKPGDDFAQARQRCIAIPIPCVPGVEIPNCMNFCPPGEETQPPAADIERLFEPRVHAAVRVDPTGSPGACVTVLDPQN